MKSLSSDARLPSFFADWVGPCCNLNRAAMELKGCFHSITLDKMSTQHLLFVLLLCCWNAETFHTDTHTHTCRCTLYKQCYPMKNVCLQLPLLWHPGTGLWDMLLQWCIDLRLYGSRQQHLMQFTSLLHISAALIQWAFTSCWATGRKQKHWHPQTHWLLSALMDLFCEFVSLSLKEELEWLNAVFILISMLEA